jgi:hypothetical protein
MQEAPILPIQHRVALLLGPLAVVLSACDLPPANTRSQLVEGLKVEYSVTRAPPPSAPRPGRAESTPHEGGPVPPHLGASKNVYHVTVAARDAKTNTPIEDATVMFNIKGHGYPGHGSMPLPATAVAGIYGGYVSMEKPGRYRLTFHVARPGRQYDPVKAVFSYDRP